MTEIESKYTAAAWGRDVTYPVPLDEDI